VRRIVLDGIHPAHVPDDIIAEIRAREREGLEPPRLAPGMHVRILQGPLHKHVGMIAALRPRERVQVLLRMLGGQREVELAQDAVGAID
jgi:transcription antitermination factor NusG